MPSCHHGHLGHLRLLGILSDWMNDMSSSHPSHLRHLRHLSHLGYLSILGNPDILNPYLLDTILTDSQTKVFITELDFKDPGPSEGYYMDDSPNPIPIATPLLPTSL
jgi:hypothetical protein